MAKTNPLRRGGLKKFFACKSGGVIIYLAFALPMLMGAMALSVDLGRVFILNSELKDFSDAAALAGAAELNGVNGARARAEAAARTGLSGTLLNVQAFATDGGGAGITVDQVVLLRSLPADGTDFTAADTATSDADARFIFVSVVSRNVRSGLSRALGAIPDFDTAAKSIAGFNGPAVCRVPAMFTCNPLEDINFPDFGCNTGVGVALQDCLIGHQMLLKNSNDYEPGNFGLIEDPDGQQGSEYIAKFLATARPDLCVTRSINTRTGEAQGPTTAGINTRFDLYENPQFGWWTDDWGDRHTTYDYRPALNVTANG